MGQTGQSVILASLGRLSVAPIVIRSAVTNIGKSMMLNSQSSTQHHNCAKKRKMAPVKKARAYLRVTYQHSARRNSHPHSYYGVGRASSHCRRLAAIYIAPFAILDCHVHSVRGRAGGEKLTMTTPEQWKPSFISWLSDTNTTRHTINYLASVLGRKAAISGESLASQSLALPGSCLGGFGLWGDGE